MYRLAVKIKIGEYVFRGALKTEITKSVDNMTATASIEMANVIYTRQNKNYLQESSRITAVIKRGDPVWIYSDYDKPFDELPLKFRGFISRSSGGEVMTFFCEDYMHVLKNINLASKRFTNVKLKDYIKYILNGAKIDYELVDPEMELGTIQIDNNSILNAVQCLETLQETYGLKCYFRDNTLVVGKLLDGSGSEHNFIFQQNILEDGLVYKNDDEAAIVIKGISLLDNNTKIERYAYLYNGVKKVSQAGINGEQITLNFYNKTAKELETLLLDNFEKYVFKGYSGQFTTLLRPRVQPGDYVNLWNVVYPERDGQYRVKSVVTETGTDGGYQKIELDYKIKDL